MKKSLLVFFVVTILTGYLWANGNQDAATEKTDEIKFMTSAAKFHEVYRDIFAQMERDENIRVDIQVIPDDQYQNLLQIKLTSKEVPDLFMHNAPEHYMSLMVDSTCVDLSGESWVSDMVNPDIVTDGNGKVWAMPQESGSFFGAMYYNADLLRDLGIVDPQPKTFEEFKDLLVEIQEKSPDTIPLFMNHRDNWTTQVYMTCGYSIALGDRGPDTYNRIMANELSFSEVPEFKMVLDDFYSLISEGYVNEDHLSAGYDEGLAAVASGKAAMIYNGEWAVSSLEAEGAEIGCFPVPWGENNSLSTGAYVQGFFVPRDGNTEGALAFLEKYSSPKYMNQFFASVPGFPGIKGIDGGSVNPSLNAMVERYMSDGNTVYQMNDYMAPLSVLWGELWGSYVEHAAGAMTSEEVLEYWDSTVSAHMKSSGQPGW